MAILSRITSSLRHLSQVRNLHVQAPAALYTVGHERLRQSGALKKGVFVNQFRTYGVKVPQMAESISEGTLKQWCENVSIHSAVIYEVGDFVQQDEEVATIETDKIDVTVNSPASGTMLKFMLKKKTMFLLVPTFFKLELGDAPKKVLLLLQRRKNLRKNLRKKLLSKKKPKKEEPKKEEPKKEAPKKEAPKKEESKSAAPAAGAEKAYGSRNETRDAVVKKHGVKFGFMSAFAKAAAEALVELPAINASIDGNEIVYHDFVDMSIAVATPKGLNIAELGKKDMAGGTFTISNGGVFGSLMGTPIINLPQTAILGMHAIKERPIAVNGKVEIRPMMYVALTYDHRLVDGREAVTFLVRIKELVEDPRRFLLGV
ncbi:dihydrolipoyllysine-residue succinyltransferase E2 component [Choanephora cucurbitarum]|nr:dihydrolipoyllysine-residue succinyltransferase E2 component [Choanephora cucurbitarum]